MASNDIDSDSLISRHKQMAMKDLGPVEPMFKSGPDHGAPARGTLLDSQRGATKSGKTNHNYGDDYK